MDKLLLFSGRNDKGVFTYVIDSDRNYLEKTASEYHPTIAAYINSAKPIKGKTQVLLTALGAGEYWGCNANADFFPEAALAYDGPEYGHKTFMTQAKVFRHHLNKNTSESFGEVLLSVYNPTYHRVELIITFNHSNARDLVARIDNGENLDFSMGCRVPYDICSICGNRAPTRKQYCDHLKYYMGKIVPGVGKQAYAINTLPKFFDISVVLIGADRIAKSLLKVASSNIPVLSSAYLAEKMAEKKQAEIQKEIPANQPPASSETVEKAKELSRGIMEVKAMEPPLPRPLLDEMGRAPLAKVVSTMTMLGIVPKPQEFQRIFLIHMGQKPLADRLDSANACFDPMSVETPTKEHVDSLGLSSSNFDELIMKKLLPHMADRSYAAPHLGSRLVIMIKKGSDYPLPTLIKISEQEASKERKPISPAMALLAAAGAYAALTHLAPKEALHSIDKLLSTTTGISIAAALGLGLIRTFNTVAGPKASGQTFSPENSNPDGSDVYSRIEALKQKPFSKVGAAMPFAMKPAAKRLFLGVPLAYMASGVLQKHKELSPYGEEGRVRSFIRRNPDIISAALIADAALSAKGHSISSRNLFRHAESLGRSAGSKWRDLNKNFGYSKMASTTNEDDFLKTADTQEVLSNSIIWPLAMGTTNLPGRIAGSLFDQAVLHAGSEILKRKKTQGIQG